MMRRPNFIRREIMKKITKKMLITKAEDLGLTKIKSLKKTDLIHRIQNKEGHDACFQQIPNCGVSPCLFRLDCLG